MKIHSKAPFRLGLAGGGSDVSPYSELYGGAVLNTTINLYAQTTIIPTRDNITFKTLDNNKTFQFHSKKELPLNGVLDLQIGVYNYIVRNFTKKALSFEMTTNMDVPTGSGLGTSSTLVVSILGAFVEWLKLPLRKDEIAHLAYKIERLELNMAGGKQDQYAATYGGVNFLEFIGDDVIVNALELNAELLSELESNLILYYNNSERKSSSIIEDQMNNIINKNEKSIEATHHVKKEAFHMKETLLSANLSQIGKILNRSWHNKKKMADCISNDTIDKIYDQALLAGATGGKISGAGGGGFMMFYAEEDNRNNVVENLKKFGGQIIKYQFVNQGLISWTEK